MPDSESDHNDKSSDISGSSKAAMNDSGVSTDDTLKILLHNQEELHKTIHLLQQQLLDKPSDFDQSFQDDVDIVNKLDQIKEEIMRQPAQLRGLKRQVNMITGVVGQSQYKNLVERLLNFLDFIKKAQKEFHSQYEDNIEVDFIEPLYNELLQILNLNDVGILDANEGQEFDANVHKCVFTHEVDDEDSANKIYQIVKPGYYFTGSDDGEREVLRHAEVVVTQFCGGNN